MRQLAAFILVIFFSSCMHFTPQYMTKRADMDKLKMRPATDFQFDLQSPGTLEFKPIIYNNIEYRGVDLLNYNRVIGFVAQRTQLANTGKLLVEEYQMKGALFDTLLIDYNKAIEEQNSAETSRVALSWSTAIFGGFTFLGVVAIVLVATLK